LSANALALEERATGSITEYFSVVGPLFVFLEVVECRNVNA